MHIAIVEDDRATRAQLVSYIERYFGRNQRSCRIDEFSDGLDILDDYKASYDLILLDIQMEHIDGLKTAQEIRNADENVFLVFITNLANYAIRGYSVNALDFVLKPVNYLMLEPILQRVEKLLARRASKYVTFPTEQGLVRLSVDQVFFVESDGHMVLIHTDRQNYRMRETMKEMERQLAPLGFYRCNNCYLINMSHLEKVDKMTVGIAGQELSISRPRYRGFMDALADFIGGGKS